MGETSITDLKQAQFHTLTTDHLGTVQMATNEAGEVTWRAQSEAFGKTTPDEQNQITMNLRFPGQYFDEETGTHYNYFRDYQPTTGRYIQRDPIGLEGGINTYAYVGGNPLIKFDHNGLQALPETLPNSSPQTPQRMPIPRGPAANDPLFERGVGSVISCGSKIPHLAVGLGLLLLPSKLSDCDTIPLPAHCEDDNPCIDLEKEVEFQKDEVKRRYIELLVDRMNLYLIRPKSLSKRKGSWPGHIQQYLNQQEYLKKAIQNAESKKCNVTVDQYAWAQTPPPDYPLKK